MPRADYHRWKINEQMGERVVNDELKPGVWASLPLTSKLPTKKMKSATALLQEAQSLNAVKDSADERLQEILDELQVIQTESGFDGLRYGGLCFRATPNKPGKSFKADKCRELLIEKAGVAPEVIKECFEEATEPTKVTKPYKREFKEIEVG